MIFSFNSRIEEYKSPFGAIASGDTIRYKLTAKDTIYIDRIVLELTTQDGLVVDYPMPYVGKVGLGISEFSTTIQFKYRGIFYYRFRAYTEVGVINLGRGSGGETAINSQKSFQQTVFDANYHTPEFAKGGIIYHIFIDRFNVGADPSCVWDKTGVLKKWEQEVTIVDDDGVFRANDFYGGNFQGIIDKLGYLKELGVTIIYLSPIFKSGSNHRYDTGDYMVVDELLGDREKFKQLVELAKAQGISIILDGVFNHTGSDSRYFNKLSSYDSIGAYQGMKSPYFDWYYFINFPHEYGCWWGITVTPTVNKKVESYRKFIYGKGGVVDNWQSLGIAGWRLDVVDELDEDFVSELSQSIKSGDQEKLIIGEVWEDASTKVAYGTLRPYLLGNQLDGVMNYPFKQAILDYCIYGNKDYFTETVMSICENYPAQALQCCMTLIGSHDTVRAINKLSGVNINHSDKRSRLSRYLTEDERAIGKRNLMIASVLQYILPGIPSVYYGDEVGLEGFEDPINRRPFPWNNIDIEILDHYKMLAKLRKKYTSELRGKTSISPHSKLLVLVRSTSEHTLTALFNHTRDAIEWTASGYSDALTGRACNQSITILPHSYRLLHC